MAIAQVAGNTRLVASAAPGTTVSKAFANNVTSGSLLFAMYHCITNDTLTFADNLNGAWTLGPSVYQSNLGALLGCAYFANSAGGACTVTGTGAANQNKGLIISEYSGAPTSSVVDGTAVSSQSSSTSTINAGTITTTQAGIVIGGAIYTPTTDPTANANFSGNVLTISGGYPIAMEEWITSTGQTAAVDWSSKDFWSAVGIAFKASGGGGGPVWVPTMMLRGVG